MKIPWLCFFILTTLWSPQWGHGAELGPKKLKSVLRKRKQSFDRYLKERDQANTLSQSAFRALKNKRRNVERARKKARAQFKRPKNTFPMRAYKRFILRRDQKLKSQEKQAKAYRRFQKRVRRVQQQKRYKINKAKAYRLE